MLKMIEEHADRVFDPDAIRVLITAFDDAWQPTTRCSI
jgi:hypothetical protein